MNKEKNVTVISSNDGPTSIFITSGKHKLSLKQQLKKKSFELRKKWYALWIKSNPHTIDETVEFIREKYDFIEVSRTSKKYQRLYQELRSSFIMQYEPHLLGEYEDIPKLESQKEEDIKKFLDIMRSRQEKAKEVPKEMFSLDCYFFEKREGDLHMEIQLESRFEYIGGGTSGSKTSKFHKIYKDVYKYYGVSEEDIKNNSKRYQNLLQTLAMR